MAVVWSATLNVDLGFISMLSAPFIYAVQLGKIIWRLWTPIFLSVKVRKHSPCCLIRTIPENSARVRTALWGLKRIKRIVFFFLSANLQSLPHAIPDTTADFSQSSQSHLGFCVHGDCLIVGNAWKRSYHVWERKRHKSGKQCTLRKSRGSITIHSTCKYKCSSRWFRAKTDRGLHPTDSTEQPRLGPG